MKSIGNRFPQRVCVNDERNVDSGSNSRSLLELFHLGKDSIVRQSVMEGTACMSAEIGGLESDTFHDAPGKCTVGISGDDMLSAADKVSQLLRLARHACS